MGGILDTWVAGCLPYPIAMQAALRLRGSGSRPEHLTNLRTKISWWTFPIGSMGRTVYYTYMNGGFSMVFM